MISSRMSHRNSSFRSPQTDLIFCSYLSYWFIQQIGIEHLIPVLDTLLSSEVTIMNNIVFLCQDLILKRENKNDFMSGLGRWKGVKLQNYRARIKKKMMYSIFIFFSLFAIWSLNFLNGHLSPQLPAFCHLIRPLDSSSHCLHSLFSGPNS